MTLSSATPAVAAANPAAEEREKVLAAALARPCVAPLAAGPCGDAFVSAFACFARSDGEPKGAECLPHYGALQACFSKTEPELQPGWAPQQQAADAPRHLPAAG